MRLPSAACKRFARPLLPGLCGLGLGSPAAGLVLALDLIDLSGEIVAQQATGTCLKEMPGLLREHSQHLLAALHSHQITADLIYLGGQAVQNLVSGCHREDLLPQ
eukprot:1649336-Pyramimonas_sp.AAC.1